MIKKMIWLISLSLVMFSSAQAADSAKYKVKYAHGGPPKALESAIHATAVGFKYMLEKRSGGKFQVEIYPSYQLGKEVDHMEAIQNNVIQLYMASAAGFHRIFPPALLGFTPYQFRNADIAMEVFKGSFGDKMKAAFEKKTGLKLLMVTGTYTYLAITNNKRPIRKPSDLQGLKMRVMDPMGIAMFKSLGASATPIAWPEVYTSLQTGVVDGQTNPGYIVAWAKLHEVQKYMTLANSQWGYQLLLANRQWYDSLTATEKVQVRDASTAAKYAGGGLTLLLDEKSTRDLIKKGMQVEFLSDEEIKAFQEIAGPASMNWVRKSMGDEWADALEKGIKEAEIKLGYR